MKRLFLFLNMFALLAASMLLAPETALAASPLPPVDILAMVGMPVSAVESQYGPASRTEPSEFGFTWHVYSKDYANFFMAGVRAGQVVAAYSAAATLRYGDYFALNSSKSSVRAALGTPLSYVRSGNIVSVLPGQDQKDVFAVGDYFVIVFYDLLAGGNVTSVMVLPYDGGVVAFTSKPPLAPQLTEAYQRMSVDLVNAARARHGLGALEADALDTRLAVSRSRDMVSRDYFGHYTPEGKSPADLAVEMGLCFTTLGENIAYGDSNAVWAHESFMNSPGHRNNVLKAAYTKIGAGVAYGGSRYVVVTNIFSNNTAEPPEPGPALKHDINGDGAITISDYTLIRLDILGIRPLVGAERVAADVNGDGAISISDYTLIRLYILGIRPID